MDATEVVGKKKNPAWGIKNLFDRRYDSKKMIDLELPRKQGKQIPP